MITRRLNAVDELYSGSILRGGIMDSLAGIYDLERLISRIVYGSANPKEIQALCFASRQLPGIKAQLKDVSSQELMAIRDAIDPLYDIADLIAESLVDEPGRLY